MGRLIIVIFPEYDVTEETATEIICNRIQASNYRLQHVATFLPSPTFSLLSFYLFDKTKPSTSSCLPSRRVLSITEQHILQRNNTIRLAGIRQQQKNAAWPRVWQTLFLLERSVSNGHLPSIVGDHNNTTMLLMPPCCANNRTSDVWLPDLLVYVSQVPNDDTAPPREGNLKTRIRSLSGMCESLCLNQTPKI